MKKTLTIKLGGVVLHIEDDAYLALSNYLEGLKRKFSNDPEAKEIIHDIEERMAEIFQQQMKDAGNAVSIEMVENAIDQLGSPNDIADDGEVHEEHTVKGNKKLYRDRSISVFGGVCSGLSQYLKIDLTLLRIIFVILLFASSFGFFFVYLVLWLALPEAVSTGQRMEMRGEPVNISSIEKKVKNKSKSPRNNKQGTSRNSNNTGETILKIFAWIVIGFFVFIILIITLGLLAGLFGLTVASTVLGGVLPEVFTHGGVFASLPSGFLTHTAQSVVGLILFIGAPVVLILFIISKVAFKHNGKVGWVVFLSIVLWVIGISILASSSLKLLERASKLDIELLGEDADGALLIEGDTVLAYTEGSDHKFNLKLKTRKGKLAFDSKDNTVLFSTNLNANDTLYLAHPTNTYISRKNNADYKWEKMEYEIVNTNEDKVSIQVILHDYQYHFNEFKLNDPAFEWRKEANHIVLPDKIGFKRKRDHKSKIPVVIVKVPEKMTIQFENDSDESFKSISADQKLMIEAGKYYKMTNNEFYLSN